MSGGGAGFADDPGVTGMAGAGRGGSGNAPGLAGRGVVDLGDRDGGVEPGMGCAKAEHEATLRPLDIFVLLDQSGSMTEDDDRWTPTTNAIKTFVNSKAASGVGIGLQYFPLGEDDDEKCTLGTYAKPDVEVAALPGNAQAMVKSIDAHYFDKENCCDGPHDGTPTRPAMEGVIQYMSNWLEAHPERDGAILLATDGEPSSVCDDNEIEDVSEIIAAAAKATPAIKTYVVGIGEEDELEELAEAGGTGVGAFVVDGTGEQTEQQLLETLAKIQGDALACDFAVPSGMDSDPSKLNVQRSTGGGAPSTLVRVPDARDCSRATAGGFYFEGERIQLCPGTCEQVRGDPTSKVAIVVGCAAQVLL